MVNGKRILAIGAHPDDAEYGCGGYMQLFNERMIVVINTMGRKNEALKGAAVLKSNIEFVADYNLPERSLIEALGKIINEFEPDVICTHSMSDTHQDHRKAALCSLSACRDYSGLILQYCAPSNRPFMPNYFAELTEAQYDAKLRAIEAHTSQAGADYFRQSALDSHFGYWPMAYRGGAKWAEPFVFHRHVVKAT